MLWRIRAKNRLKIARILAENGFQNDPFCNPVFRYSSRKKRDRSNLRFSSFLSQKLVRIWDIKISIKVLLEVIVYLILEAHLYGYSKIGLFMVFWWISFPGGSIFQLIVSNFFSLVEVDILYISSQVLCHIDRIKIFKSITLSPYPHFAFWTDL